MSWHTQHQLFYMFNTNFSKLMSDISRHLFCNFPKLLHVPPFSLSGIGFKIVSWLTHKRCQWARWYLLSFCSWDRKGVTKKHTSYVDMLMLSHLFAIGFPDKMFLHISVFFFFAVSHEESMSCIPFLRLSTQPSRKRDQIVASLSFFIAMALASPKRS